MSDGLNLDLSVLRMLKTRKRYERFASMVPAGTVNDTTKKMIAIMGDYFKKTQAEKVTFSEFWPVLHSRYPKWKPKDIEFWQASLRPIDKDNPEGYDQQVIQNLLAADLGNKALTLIEKWQGGEEVELGEALRVAVENFEAAMDRKVRTADVELDWDDMLTEDEQNIGLHWRLTCVARHLRALREGDFGIVAMRPDRGKTTWLSSEVGWMAPQLLTLYPNEKRPVLWLNNEGPGRRILGRIRQSTLGMSASEMRAIGAAAARKKFIEMIGGDESMIIVKDIHGFSHAEVEELIRKINPGLVIFDMIDNINFVGGTVNNGERTDQLLEAMYQWARSLAVRYKFAGIATSQISADGEGHRWPLQSWLKDSRTGKQGACDFILTGGFDPSMPNTRFIGTTKNKLKLEGSSGNPECQVMFDADRGRLREPEEISE